MIINYVIYKSIDYLWFSFVDIVILYIESLIWLDQMNGKCKKCKCNKSVLYSNENMITYRIEGTICRYCYIFHNNDNHERFKIEESKPDELIILAFKMIDNILNR